MRATTALGLIAAILATGCGKKTVRIDADAAADQASRWTGSLAAPAGMAGVVQIQGSAWMAADGNSTHVHIEINNATRGGEHPWHVHEGRCGGNGRILGDPSAYPILAVNTEGRATKDAHLNVPLPAYGDFYVNVHAATTNMQTIVACANLAPPTRR